jgi:hypothetical protein
MNGRSVAAIVGLFLAIAVIGVVLAGCDFPRCGVMWPCER